MIALSATVLAATAVGAALAARHALLRRLKSTPTAIIGSKSRGATYVERWHLAGKDGARWFAMLHRFAGPDLDPPHNHPGWSLTWVLAGEGEEVLHDARGTPRRSRRLRPFRVYLRSPRAIHVIHAHPHRPVVTLFLAGMSSRNYGFHTPEGMVPFVDYCKSPRNDKTFRWGARPKARRPG